MAGADKIVVLSEGTVAEEGAPETLLEQKRPLRPHGEAADREPELEIGVKNFVSFGFIIRRIGYNLRFEKYHHGLKQS